MSRNKSGNRGPVRAKKHLGQHFLRSPIVSERMADALSCSDQWAHILEVGPGTGALTQPLLQRHGKKVRAVEVDLESVAYLYNAPWIDREQVVAGDLLHMTPEQLGLGSSPFAIAGNFPYNISSQILFKALDWRDRVPELVGMFQREVAERVCAAHGSRVYGILSVLVQTYYTCEYLFTVPPEAFEPPPKVHSGVMRMVRTPERDPDVSHEALVRVVKAGFGQRRKTLRNALRNGGYSLEGLSEELLNRRAEQLAVEEFAALAQIAKLAH
ncbi:MAG: 16S rRNA (adenine(1518)-N(6)/adenine(1519)-N(6))-dimethyltransferase RsmA [Flavobacteriales bacterium]|nr:16S rRNA (adenine(1518)-N(6)/adenine(1519)-N(6))-dimethyltransferase RsmA [Flavobacteriales bacterium]